jgi:hypothetical protein
LSFGLGYYLYIACNCTDIHLILTCYVIILDTVVFEFFVLTYGEILYQKSFLFIYVLPEDGTVRPKHVGEIIMTKQIFMHEYLQLGGIKALLLINCTERVQH